MLRFLKVLFLTFDFIMGSTSVFYSKRFGSFTYRLNLEI